MLATLTFDQAAAAACLFVLGFVLLICLVLFVFVFLVTGGPERLRHVRSRRRASRAARRRSRTRRAAVSSIPEPPTHATRQESTAS